MNEGQLDHFKHGEDGERYAGDHLLIEFWGAKRLGEPEYICQALEDGARAAGSMFALKIRSSQSRNVM